MAGRVTHIDSMASWVKALKDAEDKAVVVDFFQTGCTASGTISPCFHALAGQHKNMIFLKVDIDDSQDVCTRAGITFVPTFQVYRKGKMDGAYTGTSEQRLKALCTMHAAAAPAPGPEKTKKASFLEAKALIEKALEVPQEPVMHKKRPAVAKSRHGVAKRVNRRAVGVAAAAGGSRSGGVRTRAEAKKAC